MFPVMHPRVDFGCVVDCGIRYTREVVDVGRRLFDVIKKKEGSELSNPIHPNRGSSVGIYANRAEPDQRVASCDSNLSLGLGQGSSESGLQDQSRDLVQGGSELRAKSCAFYFPVVVDMFVG